MVFQRYLLLSDVHGNSNGLHKLLHARYSQRTKFDAIILSGDFPVTTPLNLVLRYMIKNHNLSRLGYSNKVYKEELRSLFVKQQISSIDTMMQTISKFNLPIIYIPGNVETVQSVDYIKKKYPKTIFLDNKYYRFQDKVNFLGLGGSLDHHGIVCDYEFPEEYFASKANFLAEKIESLDKNDPLVFVFHEPPLFSLAQTDISKMKRKAKKRGYSYDFPSQAGSKDLYNLITKFTPRLVINGHFHEYQGITKIKNSVIVNPGAFATYYYAIATFEMSKMNKYKIDFFKIRPSHINFTNFLYQKLNFISNPVTNHN